MKRQSSPAYRLVCSGNSCRCFGFKSERNFLLFSRYEAQASIAHQPGNQRDTFSATSVRALPLWKTGLRGSNDTESAVSHTTQSRRVKSFVVASARKAVKSLGEKLLASAPVRAWARGRLRNKRLILSYHNVIASATPSGDRSLHLPRGRFAQQLDFLQNEFEIVGLDSILLPDEGPPRVAITFDDAYRGALIHGLDELARRSLPATICVAPGLLGARTTWWDALAEKDEGLRPEWRRIALLDCAGEDRLVRHWAKQQGLPLAIQDAEYEIANEAEFLAAMASPNFTAASHSWSHANLSRLPPQRVLEELRRTEEWLQERPLARVPWLAYPYGMAPTGIDIIQEMGYAGAMLVQGGWFHATKVLRAVIPRFNIPAGLSIEGFKARLAGVLS